MRSAELLGEPDEKSFGPPDVAKPIHVFVLDDFTDELRTAFAEPGERIVNVVHGEHDAEAAQSIHWGVPVICDDRRIEVPRDLEPAVAVRRAHHGDLDALVAQSSDTPHPFSFNYGSPFELEAKLAKKLNRRCGVVDDNPNVIHPSKRHMATLPAQLLPTRLSTSSLGLEL